MPEQTQIRQRLDYGFLLFNQHWQLLLEVLERLGGKDRVAGGNLDAVGRGRCRRGCAAGDTQLDVAILDSDQDLHLRAALLLHRIRNAELRATAVDLEDVQVQGDRPDDPGNRAEGEGKPPPQVAVDQLVDAGGARLPGVNAVAVTTAELAA